MAKHEKKLLKLKKEYEQLKEEFDKFQRDNGTDLGASQANKPRRCCSRETTQNPNAKEYIYAFATLRSMDGVELLKEAYDRYKKP